MQRTVAYHQLTNAQLIHEQQLVPSSQISSLYTGHDSLAVWRESVNAVLQNAHRHCCAEKHPVEKQSVPLKMRVDLHGQPESQIRLLKS